MPDKPSTIQEMESAAESVNRWRALLSAHRELTARGPQWPKEEEECMAQLMKAEEALERLVDRQGSVAPP